jgi:hypothetical protein
MLLDVPTLRVLRHFWVTETRRPCDPPHSSKRQFTIHFVPSIVAFVLHCISRRCHIHYQFEECFVLIQEEIVCRESLDRCDGASILGQRRPDDGNRGQIRAEEFTRLRQDQVRLEHLTAGSVICGGELCVMLVGRIIEIRKS